MPNHDSALGSLLLDVTINKGGLLVTTLSIRGPVGLPEMKHGSKFISFFAYGGIQLVRTQRPDPLPFSTYARPDPPLNKKCSEVHMYNFEPKAVVLL